jgi:hypothetical protein
MLSSEAIKSRLERLPLGQTLLNLNSRIVERLEIPLPPVTVQFGFADRVIVSKVLRGIQQNSLTWLDVWSDTWREIWLRLIEQPEVEDQEGTPEDVFCELYRELAKALKEQPSVEALADIIDNPLQSREAFEKMTCDDLAGERALVSFLEAVYDALEDLRGDELLNRYFNLLNEFIDKFSLRYPGIRHGGNPDGVLRNIDMRDMVAMSILLAGFTLYLSNGLYPDVVYRGA